MLTILKQIKQVFRMIGFARGRVPLYIIGLIGVSSQSLIVNYLMSFVLKKLTESALQKNLDILLQSLIILSISLVAFACLLPLFSYAFEGTVKYITGQIRKGMFDRIQHYPMEKIENSHSGDLLSRLTNDIQTAENAYGWHFGILLMSVVAGIGSVTVILSIHIGLAISAVCIGICLFLVNTVFVKPLAKVSERIQSQLSDANQKLSDTIAGNTIAKIYNLTKTLTEKYMQANLGIRSDSMKRIAFQSALNSFNWFLGFMSFVGIIIIGCIMSINGKLAVGDMMMAVQMMNGITWMFSSFGSYIAQLQGSMAGAARVFELLDAPIEVESSSYKNTVPSTDITDQFAPVIQFENITFSYNGSELILNDFSSAIYKDETAAVVGLSGSGKSTLFKLLLGFYQPRAGCIRLFGRAIEDYSLGELRGLIAYVPQDSYLFSGSIRENIAYGRMNAPELAIIEAAKAAYADEFITALPDGYNTQVGERGARLSGGQRQRIAIARALLKNAPVLLLDEATAALDSESEQQVQQALEVLMKGRTTIAVAHRLSTIQNADSILVMDSGAVIEKGTHSDLLSQNGTYARLFNLQFQSFAEASAPTM